MSQPFAPGFVAADPGATPDAERLLALDGWWPAIDLPRMRAALRLRGDVPHQRLVAAIEGAALQVMRDLSAWRSTWALAGVASLDAIEPGAAINGRTRLAVAFERAIRFAAAAELADAARTLSTTVDAERRAAPEDDLAAEYRRLSLIAVRDILGVTRTSVALI